MDADLLEHARRASGKPDSALVDEALAALLARHRSAEVDASYAAYDAHPLDEPVRPGPDRVDAEVFAELLERGGACHTAGWVGEAGDHGRERRRRHELDGQLVNYLNGLDESREIGVARE